MFAKKCKAAPSVSRGAVVHGTQVHRGCRSVPAGECQSVEGAPRRRAAPGNQLVKVAAGAATGRQTKCGASASVASAAPGRVAETQIHIWVPPPKVSLQLRPCARAQRLCTSHATEGVGASAHARHASATHRHTTNTPALFASEHNGHVRSKYGALLLQEPNPSIERTSQRPLRALWSTAHVER